MALNNKQQVFVSEYLKCWNSSEAARRAGYNGKSNVVGPRLLANVSIKEEIDARIAELVMSADEALIRLSKQARGSHADLTGVHLRDDLKDHPMADLVKTIVTEVYEDRAGKVHHKLRLELYDAQAAIRDILKIHGKFTDKVELSWRDKLPPDKDPDEVKRQFVEIMKLASKKQNANSD